MEDKYGFKYHKHLERMTEVRSHTTSFSRGICQLSQHRKISGAAAADGENIPKHPGENHLFTVSSETRRRGDGLRRLD